MANNILGAMSRSRWSGFQTNRPEHSAQALILRLPDRTYMQPSNPNANILTSICTGQFKHQFLDKITAFTPGWSVELRSNLRAAAS